MSDAWGGSWGGRFIVWTAQEQVTQPEFGEPFFDVQTPIAGSIAGSCLMATTVGRNALLADMVEVVSRFPASRISRSVK